MKVEHTPSIKKETRKLRLEKILRSGLPTGRMLPVGTMRVEVAYRWSNHGGISTWTIRQFSESGEVL